MSWHGGKGSSPRKVNKEKFDANWDAIFSKKEVQNWEHYCIGGGHQVLKETDYCKWCDASLESKKWEDTPEQN